MVVETKLHPSMDTFVINVSSILPTIYGNGLPCFVAQMASHLSLSLNATWLTVDIISLIGDLFHTNQLLHLKRDDDKCGESLKCFSHLFQFEIWVRCFWIKKRAGARAYVFVCVGGRVVCVCRFQLMWGLPLSAILTFIIIKRI